MDRFDRSRRRFAMVLAALAGFVDAEAVLSGRGYFVSFMSGNTTRLGVDLAADMAGQTASALVPFGLILGFVGGVASGTFLAARTGARRKATVLALVAVVLAAGAGLHATGAFMAALGPLVLAMGALNATFWRDGEAPVGLTYMTGALVRLGQAAGARLAGVAGPSLAGHAGLWAGLLAGAIAGATAYRVAEPASLWISALWAAAMAVVARRLPPEPTTR